MRKVIKIVLLFFIILVISYLGIVIYKKIEIKKFSGKNVALLPDLSFLTLENKTFSPTQVNSKNNKIIINYFNPECEHCQYMAQSYVQNAEKLKLIQIIMVTIADSDAVAKFKTDYHLDKLSNVLLLRDTKFQFQKIFGASVVPSFFIYQNKKLVKKIIGETKIENLLQ